MATWSTSRGTSCCPSRAWPSSQIAGWARYMRSSMLEVLHQDYVRTARAKGLPGCRVLGKHALRNALIPIITLLGLSIRHCSPARSSPRPSSR